MLIISLITFLISTTAPGDPVEQMLTSQTGDGSSSANLQANEESYLEKRKELGLDLPIFYFSIGQKSIPDTLHRIPKPAFRKNLSRLINDYGNWPQISDYYHNIKKLQLKLASVQRDSANATPLIQANDGVKALYIEPNPDKMDFNLEKISKAIVAAPSIGGNSGIGQELAALKSSYNEMTSKTSTWKNYVPSFKFYGLDNQYHRWFFGDKPLFSNGDGNWASKGFLRGDFGISYKDQRPVSSVLFSAVRWTFMISIISILLTYLIAIPLGVFSAKNKGKLSDGIITSFLFIMYSLPSFWIAILAVVFLCGGDYLGWFPPFFNPDLSGGFFSDFKSLAYNLILPLFCWTYGSLAFLSRQMRGGMLSVLGQDYIRTAKSKGLPDSKITWKHAMRNSLLPIITLFASVFPLAISGAIVLEVIFSIPGMGKVGYEAVVSRNYPIVFAVMMFSAILTLIGYLVADILYAVVDPRISYNSKK